MRFLVITSLFLLILSVSGYNNRGKYRASNHAQMKENAFVRIHIKNPQIVKRVTSIQKQLSGKSQKLKQFFQSPKSLHITIITTAIDTSNINYAIEALENGVKQFKKSWLVESEEFGLEIRGLSSFGHRVLIGQPSNTNALPKLNKMIMKAFKERGLLAYNSVGHAYKFHPHMTIVNIKDGSKDWLGSTWDNMLDSSMKLGIEIVDSIQLVNFGVNPSTQDYNVIHEVRI